MYRCYIQEILACLILLSDTTWNQRISLLFDVFNCSGNNEMSYDDVVLASQVVAMALHRLWVCSEWDQSSWSNLTESLADSAFAKVSYKLHSSPQ